MSTVGSPPSRTRPPPPPARSQPHASGTAAPSSTTEPTPPARERTTARPTAGAAYHVKPGDTLWDMSRKAYGDPTRWPEIRDANPKQVTRDGHVRAGVTLHLPPAQHVDGYQKEGRVNPYSPAQGTARAPEARPTVQAQIAEEKALRQDLAQKFTHNLAGARRGGLTETTTAAARARAQTLESVQRSPEKAAVLQRSDARLATARATEAIDQAKASMDQTRALRGRLDTARQQLAEATVNQFTGGSVGYDRVADLGGEVQRLNRETAASSAQSRTLQDQARVAADQALTAQRSANAAARRAGNDPPFPAARDVGSLNKAMTLPADQQKAIFGTAIPPRLGSEFQVTPAELQAQKDQEAVTAAQKQINDAANRIHGTDKPYAGSDDEKNARREATLTAAQTVQDVLHQADPRLRQQILEGTGGAMDRVARGMTILDGDDTRRAVTSLTRATDEVGPAGAHLITAPMAHVISTGGMEEHGSLLGRHEHRSEQELVDGIQDTLHSGESNLFARSLTQGLLDRKDNAFAQAVATGGGVPGKNWAERINDGVTGAVDAAKDFVGDLADATGDWARNKLAETIGVDDRIRELNSEGDKFTLGLGGSLGAFGVQGGASAEMQVQRTKDGYSLTVTGEASAGVFAKLGTKSALGGAGAEANLAGRISLETQYKTQEEAIAAAKTISGIGCATVVAGPAGTLLTGLTAGDEIKNIQDHVTKTTVELELSGSAGAGFAQSTGVGFGGGGSVEAAAKVGVEFVPGQPPTLRVGQSLQAQGDIRLGAPVDLGDGNDMHLSPANLGAKGTVALETRMQLPNVDVGRLLSDPVGTVKALGQDVKDTAVTHAEVDVDLKGNIGLVNGTSSQGVGGGVNVQLAVDAPTRDVVGALGSVLSGDMRGGLARLSDSAQVEAQVNTFKTDGFRIDEEINAGVFKVGVKAEYSTRDETDVFTYSGTPRELLARSGDVLGLFALNFR